MTEQAKPLIPGVPLFRRGKVRDTYDLGDRLLMIASDRISAFDVVLPTPIPGKGVLLTQLSAFWFARTADIVPNHLITADLNDPAAQPLPAAVVALLPALQGRSSLVQRADRIDVECVVRGYVYGSVWDEYQKNGTVAGVPQPAGLQLAGKLPEPVFSPAMKVDDGHDVNVTKADLAAKYGSDLADRLESVSLRLYRFAADWVAERGLILADTKFEFGFIDGRLSLIDEILTPDSSRYWDAEHYAPGKDPASFDKQYVRDWLSRSGWDKQPPGPELPAEIVRGTVERYREAYERIVGQPLPVLAADETPSVTEEQ